MLPCSYWSIKGVPVFSSFSVIQNPTDRFFIRYHLFDTYSNEFFKLLVKGSFIGKVFYS